MSASEVVLVTGGTGFVGSYVARELAARGREVHVLARAGSDRSVLAGIDAVFHAGDLEDERSVAQAVNAAAARKGGAATAVVHSAALISYRDEDRGRSHAVNVEGTRRVLEACRRERIGRVVHVSSVVAVGFAPDARSALDEDAVFNGAPLRCAYVDTKRAAEELALSAADELELSVVNPGAIFGPAARPSNTTRFLGQIARGGLGPFAPPGSLSVVGIADVADGIVRVLEHGRRGARYLLTNENYTHAELFGLAARELGARAPRFTLPEPLWRAAVLGATAVHRLRPLTLATPQALRLLGVHSRFDARRARDELGWSPQPFTEVLSGTVAWMRASGLLAPGPGGPAGKTSK